jgi:hypothetical protein
MAVSAVELWADRRHWPLTPKGYLFVVPGFNRIGRHLYGDSWHDEFPAKNPLPLPPAAPDEADATIRAWAHSLLSLTDGEAYSADYKEPPAQALSSLGLGLGGQAPGTGNLARLGEGLLAAGPTGDVGADQTGYRFTGQQWDRFRSVVHYQNELMKPDLEKVRGAARWLYDAVFAGSVLPHLMKQGGGDWRASEPDDWMMPDLDRLRLRVRYARMVPGQAGSMAGSHWIFLPEAALDAALMETAGEVVSDPSTGADPETSGPTSLDDSAAATTTVAMVKQATQHVAELLRNSPNLKKEDAFASVRQVIGHVSQNQLTRSVWPDAREAAGLPRKAASGPKPKAAA